MSGITVNQEALASVVAKLDINKPVTMLNMIRFRDKPHYTANTSSNLDRNDNISGQEAYMSRYLPAYQAVMERYGGFEVKFLSTNTGSVVSTEDDLTRPWDAIAMIQYRSLKDFKDLTVDSEYVQKAEPHRMASVKEWRLVACA